MQKQALKKLRLSNPYHFCAIGFGSGLAPKAPGTFGTLAGVVLYLGLHHLSPLYYALIIVASFAFGVVCCQKASDAMGVHDHGGIVWDEFVGFWITMMLIPFSWLNLLLGFALFRFFDIIKPWPIKWLDQKVSGGFGIMIDDVLAGIFAWLCLYSLNLFVL